MNSNTFQNVDAYIASQPEDVQRLLQQMRATIRKAAPNAEEVISYSMPAYKDHGMLVYFAGFKSHIGFYPTASGIRVFQADIAKYKNSKGAVQFPLDEPLPLALVTRIVKYRVEENREKAMIKAAVKNQKAKKI
jgi:uncharacterized protein YdhG (YjbR/CyaY superfamily)